MIYIIHILYVLIIHIVMDIFDIMINYLLYVIIIILIYGIKMIRKMPISLTHTLSLKLLPQHFAHSSASGEGAILCRSESNTFFVRLLPVSTLHYGRLE
jgi:hypothetical protein